MQVRVKLIGTLPALLKRSDAESVVEVEPGATLVDLMRVMSISPQLVMVFAVNGKVQRGDYELHDGDEVAVMPAVAGG